MSRDVNSKVTLRLSTARIALFRVGCEAPLRFVVWNVHTHSLGVLCSPICSHGLFCWNFAQLAYMQIFAVGCSDPVVGPAHLHDSFTKHLPVFSPILQVDIGIAFLWRFKRSGRESFSLLHETIRPLVVLNTRFPRLAHQ